MQRNFRRFAVLGVLCLLAIASPAGDAPTRQDVNPERDLAPASDWYGLYGPQGKKIGCLHASLALHGSGESAFYRRTENAKVQTSVLGERIDMEMQSHIDFDPRPPYALRGGRSKESDGTSEKVLVLARSEKGFEATIEEAGEKRRMQVPEINVTLADELAPEIWIRRQKRAVGEKWVSPSFDIEELTTDIVTCVIKASHETVADGVRMTYYDVQLSSEKDGDLGIVRSTQAGKLISAKVGGLFEMRLEPEALAKKIEASSDLFVSTMAPVDAPLGDPEAVTRLVLEVSGAGAGKIASGANQALTKEGDVYVLSLGAGQGTPASATAADLAEYTKESVHLPIKHEKIVALAGQAVGNAKNDKDKVAKLVSFVSEYIEDNYSAEPLTVLDLIRVKKGDCTEHAALFATLARAAGIPAREVSGLMYMGDEFKAFGGHAWNEVVLDGKWVAVDATWNRTKLTATHIRLNSADRDQGTSMNVLGQVKFKLREVVPEPKATSAQQK